MPSTSKRRGRKSYAASIASLPKDEIEDLIGALSDNAQAAMPYLFDIWGMPGHQLPPEGAWSTWLILGGRGAGKTRAGAEWIRGQVEGAEPGDPGKRRRVALIGATMDEARDIMVKGESGLIACSPPDRKPVWHEGRRMLVWPNGAEAVCYSAASPEKLRGPQFDCAWSDELGKWPNPRKAWDMLQLGLRLGDMPQQVVTTTPRANPVLEALIEDPRTITVSAPTTANSANLAETFLERVTEAYGGTAQGREELDGEMVLSRPGALWTRDLIEASRVRSGPEMRRIVVAVDPPASVGAGAEECGIIVAGVGGEPEVGYVMADCSSQGETPQGWAARAVDAYERFRADRIVAEVNQGGAMVEAVIRQIDPKVSFRAVHASRGKQARAEPVSALYEQGRVLHLGGFADLEDQMRGFGADGAGASPDRVDALVWAITDLMLDGSRAVPRARTL
ncbi:MAG: terminase family protein [Pseudomonadota bacterium]